MAILKMIRAEAKEDSQGNIVRKYHDNNARSDLIDYLTNPRKCVESEAVGSTLQMQPMRWIWLPTLGGKIKDSERIIGFFRSQVRSARGLEVL